MFCTLSFCALKSHKERNRNRTDGSQLTLHQIYKCNVVIFKFIKIKLCYSKKVSICDFNRRKRKLQGNFQSLIDNCTQVVLSIYHFDRTIQCTCVLDWSFRYIKSPVVCRKYYSEVGFGGEQSNLTGTHNTYCFQ